MSRATTHTTSRSAELLAVLEDYRQVFVVMHDNPDPDAIATGWSIVCLVEERLGLPVRLIGGGAIVRAENKHMVELLSPPIQLATRLVVPDDAATVLVDCGVRTTNHLAVRSGVEPIAVIDHHGGSAPEQPLRFSDVRSDAAASASIAASYLREQGVEPGAKLATAVLYALRTETRGGETGHSDLDCALVEWLTPRADLELLAAIENAPLEREYFSDLALAMQNTMVYGETALCFLPQAQGAEIVGEVADLLIRCRGVIRVLCAALIGDDLLLSARTEHDEDNAAELLQQTIEGLGGCGGHSHRAGGKISAATSRGEPRKNLHAQLRHRWLAACGASEEHGSRLVATPDVVDNL